MEKEFQVQVAIAGAQQTITVTPAESSDGIAYYICKVDGKEITQVRKDEETWKQLWGELSDEEVTAIGKGIEAKILNQ